MNINELLRNDLFMQCNNSNELVNFAFLCAFTNN